MTFEKVKRMIEMDKARNVHPKNRFFIYCFRIGQWSYENRKSNIIMRLIYFVCRILMKLTANRVNHYPIEVKVGGGIKLPHNMGIVISGKAIIGENCTIFHQVTIGANVTKGIDGAPIIGCNVFIGAGAKIIGDIIVGDNVKIGANAIVTKNVPDNSTVINDNQVLVQ